MELTEVRTAGQDWWSLGFEATGLTDRDFGPWAARAWPRLSDDILTSYGSRQAAAFHPEEFAQSIPLGRRQAVQAVKKPKQHLVQAREAERSWLHSFTSSYAGALKAMGRRGASHRRRARPDGRPSWRAHSSQAWGPSSYRFLSLAAD